jgi:hypothetical protein
VATPAALVAADTDLFDVEPLNVEVVDADVSDVKVSEVDVADTKSVDCQRIEIPFPWIPNVPVSLVTAPLNVYT